MSDLLLKEYESLSDKEKDDFMEYVNSISLRNKILNGGMGPHLTSNPCAVKPFQLGDPFPYPDPSPKRWELIDARITVKDTSPSLDVKYRRRWVGGRYVDERI